MATKQEFAKFMVTMSAAIPRFAPNAGDPNVLEVWYAELGQLDIAALYAVYKQAVAKFDSFPSMRQILELAGMAPQSDEDKGREVGERIWTAISKFGSQVSPAGMAKVNEFLGEIGQEVVRLQGGWNQLCDIATYDNAPALKAQWRELAEVIVRKGGVGEAPTFDRLPPKVDDAIKRLVEKCDITPKDKG